ncbi:MAG: TonB family protein [Gemmatimonadota bacterium]|jgi:TonB family protein
MKANQARGLTGTALLLLTACAPAATSGGVEDLTPAQRGTALLLPDEPPEGRSCRLHRLRITPIEQDEFVRVGESYQCIPRLRNRYDITRRLNDAVRAHPNIAKLPDRQRTTSIWIHVGRDGNVLGTRVHRSSGRADVDRIAVEAASTATFDPAIIDNQPYRMWISLPIIVQERKTGS